MKKTAGFTAILLIFMLLFSACGTKNKAGRNFARVLDEMGVPGWDAQSKPPTEATEQSDADFTGTLGFSIQGTDKVDGVSPNKFYSINGWIAQVQYQNEDGRFLVLRVAKYGGKSLASTYSENHGSNPENYTIQGIQVTSRQSKQGCCLVSWQKDGYQFTLHSHKKQQRPSQQEIESFVTALYCTTE